MDIKLEVALIAAAVSVVGWVVSHWLQQQREDRRRSLEGRLSYLGRQIEDLYGPLFSLVEQLMVTDQVRKGFWRQAGEDLRKKRSDIDVLLYSDHFQPLHDEIRHLLKTNLHLVDGGRLPASFYEYLRHSMQERVQWDLWRQHKMDTNSVDRVSYPPGFTDEVRGTLKNLLQEYESAMKGLHRAS